MRETCFGRLCYFFSLFSCVAIAYAQNLTSVSVDNVQDSIDLRDGAHLDAESGTYLIRHLRGQLQSSGANEVIVWTAVTEALTLNEGSEVIVYKPSRDPFIFWVPDNAKQDNLGAWELEVIRMNGGATSHVTVDNAAHSIDREDGASLDTGPGVYVIRREGGVLNSSGANEVIVWTATMDAQTLSEDAEIIIRNPSRDPFIFWAPDNARNDNSGTWTLAVKDLLGGEVAMVEVDNAVDAIDKTQGAIIEAVPGIYAIRHSGGVMQSSGANEVIVWTAESDAQTLDENAEIIVRKTSRDPFIFWVPDNAKQDNSGSWNVDITKLEPGNTTMVTVDNASNAIDKRNGASIDAVPGVYAIRHSGGVMQSSGANEVIVWTAESDAQTLNEGGEIVVIKPSRDPFVFWVPDNAKQDNSGAWVVDIERLK